MFTFKRTRYQKDITTEYETLDEAIAIMDYEFDNGYSCCQIVIDPNDKIVYTPVEDNILKYPEYSDYSVQEL